MNRLQNEGKKPFVTIARIVRTRGIKGEVWVDLLTDFPDRFSKLDHVFLLCPDGRFEVRELERFWFQKGRLIAKFKQSDSIEEAKKLVNCEIQIPEEALERLPPGTYFDFQLLDCLIVTEDGRHLGKVTEILKAHGNDLLVVTEGREEILIPVAEEFCRHVDVDHKTITVRMPTELLELNRRGGK